MWKTYYIKEADFEEFVNSKNLKPSEFFIILILDNYPKIGNTIKLLVYKKEDR